MTKDEFTALPYLLTPGQVVSCGYSPTTLRKYTEHGVLRVVLPTGCGQRRFEKRQLAQMLGWTGTLDLKAWAAEKPLLGFGAVHWWTGYEESTIRKIVEAGGLVAIKPGGLGYEKYRKEQIGAWLGL